jgi:hypothetical protein
MRPCALTSTRGRTLAATGPLCTKTCAHHYAAWGCRGWGCLVFVCKSIHQQRHYRKCDNQILCWQLNYAPSCICSGIHVHVGRTLAATGPLCIKTSCAGPYVSMPQGCWGWGSWFDCLCAKVFSDAVTVTLLLTLGDSWPADLVLHGS